MIIMTMMMTMMMMQEHQKQSKPKTKKKKKKKKQSSNPNPPPTSSCSNNYSTTTTAAATTTTTTTHLNISTPPVSTSLLLLLHLSPAPAPLPPLCQKFLFTQQKSPSPSPLDLHLLPHRSNHGRLPPLPPPLSSVQKNTETSHSLEECEEEASSVIADAQTLSRKRKLRSSPERLLLDASRNPNSKPKEKEILHLLQSNVTDQISYLSIPRTETQALQHLNSASVCCSPKVSNADASPSSSPLPAKKTLRAILDKLQKKDKFGVFAQPVNVKEVPNYDIIKDPMDFGTIRKRISSDYYTCLSTFQVDIFLICDNAMIFNAEGTVYYRHARAIRDAAEKILEDSKKSGFLGEMVEMISKQKLARSKLKKSHKKHERSSTSFMRGTELGEGTGISGRMFERKGSNECSGSLSEVNLEDTSGSTFGENARGTYKPMNTITHGMDSLLTVISGGSLHYMPTWYQVDFPYARSLAHFSADMGPHVRKVAAEKIRRALPLGLAFGPGWIGERGAPSSIHLDKLMHMHVDGQIKEARSLAQKALPNFNLRPNMQLKGQRDGESIDLNQSMMVKHSINHEAVMNHGSVANGLKLTNPVNLNHPASYQPENGDCTEDIVIDGEDNLRAKVKVPPDISTISRCHIDTISSTAASDFVPKQTSFLSYQNDKSTEAPHKLSLHQHFIGSSLFGSGETNHIESVHVDQVSSNFDQNSSDVPSKLNGIERSNCEKAISSSDSASIMRNSHTGLNCIQLPNLGTQSHDMSIMSIPTSSLPISSVVLKEQKNDQISQTRTPVSQSSYLRFASLHKQTMPEGHIFHKKHVLDNGPQFIQQQQINNVMYSNSHCQPPYMQLQSSPRTASQLLDLKATQLRTAMGRQEASENLVSKETASQDVFQGSNLPFTKAPDLNVGLTSMKSPFDQSSGREMHQPDLSLQL